LPPSVAVPLVLICSIVAQTSTLPSIWRSIDFKLLWPFVLGGVAGVPIGTMLVAYADPRTFRLSVGVMLLVFPAALYFHRRPMALSVGGRIADTGIGFAGGVLGGLAGLSGPIPILWASVRGWGKDERRSLFQIFNWAVLTAALCVQAGTGFPRRRARPVVPVWHRADLEHDGNELDQNWKYKNSSRCHMPNSEIESASAEASAHAQFGRHRGRPSFSGARRYSR